MIGVVPESFPWSRVDQPTAIPSPLNADTIAALDADAYRNLIRDHLIPRDDSAASRSRWQSLWGLLAADELRRRTFDVLENLMDQADAHLRSSPDDRRAQQFRHRCNATWERLTRPGSDRSKFGELSAAVREHRAAVLASGEEPRAADTVLWGHLRRGRG